MVFTSTVSRKIDNCKSAAKEIGKDSPCTENANCISTETSYYCKCRPGYFGNPDAQGSCLRDITRNRKVIPQKTKFPLIFQQQLSVEFSDDFRIFKKLIEEIFERVYTQDPSFAQNSTRIFKFL